MNSYIFAVKILEFIQYKFIEFMDSYIFAVQNKSCERVRATSARRKRTGQAASAQRKPRGQSPSSPFSPTRPRPAAQTIRVAYGSPNS